MAHQNSEPAVMPGPKVVVGLDFGTTFSGFAFAKKTDLNSPPRFFADWPPLGDGTGRTPYSKTTTSLWYARQTPGQLKLKYWGWSAKIRHATIPNHSEACDTISDASREVKNIRIEDSSTQVNMVKCDSRDNREDGEFVTHFKLLLGASDGGSEARRLVDPLPEGLDVDEVVRDYLSKIGHFALAEVKSAFGNDISMTDLQWVVSVPSIWDDKAKQRMKHCMARAHLVQPRGGDNNGGSRHELVLVLEPEAGSIYARSPIHWPIGAPRLPPRARFVVVDAGGGTVDLVGQRELKCGATKEVTESSGGCYGGKYIDEYFEKHLRARIPVLEEYMKDHPSEMIEFMEQWHRKGKNTFRGNPKEDVVLDLTSGLLESWERYNKTHGIEEPDTDTDDITLSSQDMRDIFDPIVNNILRLIGDHVREIGKCKAILMVGGFSESVYLRRRIQEEFPGMPVVKPENAGAAVCIGAAMFGLRPDLVVSRISRKTYGIGVLNTSLQLNPAYFITRLGSPFVLALEEPDKFLTFVKKGDEVRFDSHIRHIVCPSHPESTKIVVELFSSESTDVEFTDEDGVKKEGSFSFLIPDVRKGLDREVEIQMYFGRSSVEVRAHALNFRNGRHEDGALWVEFSALDVE